MFRDGPTVSLMVSYLRECRGMRDKLEPLRKQEFDLLSVNDDPAVSFLHNLPRALINSMLELGQDVCRSVDTILADLDLHRAGASVNIPATSLAPELFLYSDRDRVSDLNVKHRPISDGSLGFHLCDLHLTIIRKWL